eukprot:6551244-Prymnesium_polylepis.2
MHMRRESERRTHPAVEVQAKEARFTELSCVAHCAQRSVARQLLYRESRQLAHGGLCARVEPAEVQVSRASAPVAAVASALLSIRLSARLAVHLSAFPVALSAYGVATLLKSHATTIGTRRATPQQRELHPTRAAPREGSRAAGSVRGAGAVRRGYAALASARRESCTGAPAVAMSSAELQCDATAPPLLRRGPHAAPQDSACAHHAARDRRATRLARAAEQWTGRASRPLTPHVLHSYSQNSPPKGRRAVRPSVPHTPRASRGRLGRQRPANGDQTKLKRARRSTERCRAVLGAVPGGVPERCGRGVPSPVTVS